MLETPTPIPVPKPDYWLEINYHDGRTLHLPFIGTWDAVQSKSAAIVGSDVYGFIDFLVILKGSYKPGRFAHNNQILADFQGYKVPGSRPYKPEFKDLMKAELKGAAL